MSNTIFAQKAKRTVDKDETGENAGDEIPGEQPDNHSRQTTEPVVARQTQLLVPAKDDEVRVKLEHVEFLGELAKARSPQPTKSKSQEELSSKLQQEHAEYVESDDDTGDMVTVCAIRNSDTETGKNANGREKAMKDSNLMKKKLAEEQRLKVKREEVFAETAPFNADLMVEWIDEDAHTTPTKKVVATSRPMSPANNVWKRKQADLTAELLKSPVSRKVLKWDSSEGLKAESLRLRQVQVEQKAKWMKNDAVLEQSIRYKWRQAMEKAECEANALAAKNIRRKKQADEKAKWVNADALKNIKGN